PLQAQLDQNGPHSKITLPSGTVLQVALMKNAPMKLGAPLKARLLYPVYANGKIALTAGTFVMGEVTALVPDHSARVHGRFYGDFTPFHTPQVKFDVLKLSSASFAFQADAAGGAPVLRLSRPATSPHHNFLVSQWNQSWAAVRDSICFFTAPGRGDRMVQFIYHQLPYHPQRIDKNSAWTLVLNEPLELPSTSATANDTAVAASTAKAGETTKEQHPLVEALLMREVDSNTAHPGDKVTAVVVEPYFNPDSKLTIPQRAMLIGKVTEAKAARSFGRSGKLRFAFEQVQMPSAEGTEVEGALAGAATEQPQDLKMDAEGGVSPRRHSNPIVPLALSYLATRSLDFDETDTALQSSVASNGFGLVGRVVGTAAGSREFAAAIGFYAVALSTYTNYFRPGHNVDFPKDTRIEVDLAPVHAPVIKPQNER
ncbi:MAG: hypothetical protein KGN79_00175, partial [Acidobacteriota bacterium]|nr:hypothetical protein [Acidobacteriota bacterium]